MSISTLNLWANRWAQRSRELWFEVSADRLKAGIFITGRLVVLLPSALVERNCPLHLLLAGNPPADSWACPTVSTNVHARHSSNSLFQIPSYFILFLSLKSRWKLMLDSSLQFLPKFISIFQLRLI